MDWQGTTQRPVEARTVVFTELDGAGAELSATPLDFGVSSFLSPSTATSQQAGYVYRFNTLQTRPAEVSDSPRPLGIGDQSVTMRVADDDGLFSNSSGGAFVRNLFVYGDAVGMAS